MATERVFKDDLLRKAQAKIAEYPQSRSAILPLLHMLQDEAGHVTRSGMREIAELLGLTAAEVLGTASFYTLFKLEPVGQNLVSVCTGLTCQLLDGDELFDNIAEHYGLEDLETTVDGKVTVEEVECLAACGGGPCLQVNYRFFEFVAPDDGPALIDDITQRGLDTVFAEKGSERAPLPPVTAEEIAAGPAPLNRPEPDAPDSADSPGEKGAS